MDTVKTVAASPNRTNTRLGLISVSGETLECLDWVVREVKDKGLSMAHILIYCPTINPLARVFNYLLGVLDEDAWVDRDPEQKSENLLIGIFHSHTHAEDKSRLLASLGGEGSCRVIVATEALGSAFDFPKVSHVIMYGAPEDVETIVRQAGRAGRDGSQSHAAVYVIKEHTRTRAGVKALLNNGKTSCFREVLYGTHTPRVEPGHLCCTYCSSLCSCANEGCGELAPNYETLQVEVSTRCREVLPQHKARIREMLEAYEKSLVPANAHLFTSRVGCTGFGTELIDTVVEHSYKIFDLAYIKRNIPVFFERHAKKILKVIGEVFQDIDGIDMEDLETSEPSPLPVSDMYYTGYYDEADDNDDEEDD